MEILKIIAKETVDIKGIGYYSLGAYRKKISDKKKDDYFKIFEQYFLKSFSSRLAEYTDPKIRVDTQKKQIYDVSSTLLGTSEKPEIKIDWRVITKNPDNPLIIDVIIEGVSLAKVQREEFKYFRFFIINFGNIQFEKPEIKIDWRVITKNVNRKQTR